MTSDERERAIRRVASRVIVLARAISCRADLEAALGEIWDAAQAQYAADRLRPAIVDEWEDEARARGLLHDTAASRAQREAEIARLNTRCADLERVPENNEVWRDREWFPFDAYCVLCGVGQKWAAKHGHEKSCALAAAPPPPPAKENE